jgi:thioesterase domain-containing protein
MVSALAGMKGNDVMSDAPDLSQAKRALLEKYLRGDISQDVKAAGVGIQRAKAEVAGPRERVMEIQAGGSKRPFFFLHGHWKGAPFFCFSLASELGSDQPFYGLEPYQFDGLSVPPTVETMAAAHLKSMRAVQPEGPYLLGGWCNGGLVAYEMARQLHAAGQTVDLLVLMDSMYLGYNTRRRLLRWVISRLGKLMRRGPDEQLDWFLRLLYVCKPLQHAEILPYVYRRLRNALHGNSEESVRLIADKLISLVRRKAMTSIRRVVRKFEPGHRRDQERAAVPRLDSLVPIAEALRQDYLGIFEWIDMGYMPPSLYPGKITFFWPRDGSWHTISGGWRKVAEAKGAQEVEVYEIPGNQWTWKAEHLHVLAERLRMCLSRVQKEAT